MLAHTHQDTEQESNIDLTHHLSNYIRFQI